MNLKKNLFFYLVLAISLFTYFIPSEIFQFDRTDIFNGQIWRVLTGHFVHIGWRHLLLNLGGLALIWALFTGFLSDSQWGGVFLCSSLLISLGLLLFHPDISIYVGLSGVLKGLFVAGSFARIRAKQWEGWILLGLVIFSFSWELFFGSLPGSAEFIGGAVGREAHWYGALGGMIILYPPFYRRRN